MIFIRYLKKRIEVMMKKFALSMILTIFLWAILYLIVCQHITNYLNYNLVNLNYDIVHNIADNDIVSHFSIWDVFSNAAFYSTKPVLFTTFSSDYIGFIIMVPIFAFFLFFKFIK